MVNRWSKRTRPGRKSHSLVWWVNSKIRTQAFCSPWWTNSTVPNTWHLVASPKGNDLPLHLRNPILQEEMMSVLGREYQFTPTSVTIGLEHMDIFLNPQVPQTLCSPISLKFIILITTDHWQEKLMVEDTFLSALKSLKLNLTNNYCATTLCLILYYMLWRAPNC